MHAPVPAPEKLPGLLHRVAGALSDRWPFAWRAGLEVDCARCAGSDCCAESGRVPGGYTTDSNSSVLKGVSIE